MLKIKRLGKEDLSIGALAEKTGVHLETIRYYERIGLMLAAPRSQANHRLYGMVHVKRLAFIRRSRELGFTLDQIQALLALAEDRTRSCGEARQLGRQHLSEIHTKLVDLKRMERVLKRMVEQCADGNLPDCPLIEALFDVPTKPAKSARVQ